MEIAVKKLVAFATEVWIVEPFGDETAQLNMALIKDSRAWRKSDQVEVMRSNLGGWHSPVTLQNRSEKSFRKLFKEISRCVRQIAASNCGDPNLKGMSMIGQGWINMNGPTDINSPHVHPGFTFSAVYYIKNPVNKTNSKTLRDGHIVFDDVSGRMFTPHADIFLGNRKTSASLGPSAGQLYIFPSDLLHWVAPHLVENEERVTAALNFRFSNMSERR